MQTKTMTRLRLNGTEMMTVQWSSLQKHWTFCEDMKQQSDIDLDKWIQVSDVDLVGKIKSYMQGVIQDTLEVVYTKSDWKDIDQIWHAMESIGIKDEYHGKNVELTDYFAEFLQGNESPFNSIAAMIRDFQNRESSLWKHIAVTVNNSMLQRWEDFKEDCDRNMHRMNPYIRRTRREIQNIVIKYWKYKVDMELSEIDVEDCTPLVDAIGKLPTSDVPWLLNFLGADLMDIFDHMAWLETTDEMDKVLTAVWNRCKGAMNNVDGVSDEIKMTLMGIRKFVMTGTSADWLELTQTIDSSKLNLKYQEGILYYFVLNIIGMKVHGDWTSERLSELLIQKNNEPVKSQDWSIAKLWVQWLQRFHGAEDTPVVEQVCGVWDKMGLVNKFKFGIQVFKYYAYEMDNFQRPIPRTMVKYCQKWVLSEPWTFENVNEEA